MKKFTQNSIERNSVLELINVFIDYLKTLIVEGVRCINNNKKYFIMHVITGQDVFEMNSTKFKTFIKKQYRDKYKSFLNKNDVESIIDTLEATIEFRDIEGGKRFIYDGVNNEIRYKLSDGCYLVINQDGYTIQGACKDIFIEEVGAQKLALPSCKVGIDEFKALMNKYFNLLNDEQMLMIYAYITTYFLSKQKIPLFILGEPGSGKTMIAKYLQAMLDPNGSPLQYLSKNENTMIQTMNSRKLIIFDNIYTLDEFVSRILCQNYEAGSSVMYRKLYTDCEMDEIKLDSSVILTSTRQVIKDYELLDRLILLKMKPLKSFKESSSLQKDFYNDLPKIVSGMSNMLSLILSKMKSTKEEMYSDRVTSFIYFGRLTAIALGISTKTFDEAFLSIRKNAIKLFLNNFCEVDVVLKMAERLNTNIIEGRPDEVFKLIIEEANDLNVYNDDFCKNACSFTRKLNKYKEELQRIGITVSSSRGQYRKLSIKIE